MLAELLQFVWLLLPALGVTFFVLKYEAIAEFFLILTPVGAIVTQFVLRHFKRDKD